MCVSARRHHTESAIHHREDVMDRLKEFDQLRNTIPDLEHQDPLSIEVREWLDKACEAVRKVDEVEGVIFQMHRRFLFDPAKRAVASAEIAETVERARRMRAVMQRAMAQGSA